MTGQLDIDFAQLTEKLEQVCDQINTYGRVSDFLENPEVNKLEPIVTISTYSSNKNKKQTIYKIALHIL